MVELKKVKEKFERSFGSLEQYPFFAHGRVEVLGNHVDHNGGVCLVGGIDLGITAIAGKIEEAKIEVDSEGYPPFTIDLHDLEKKEEEEGKPIAIVKGVLKALHNLGYGIGGFVLSCLSDIPGGSGLSSSACFESLICQIVSDLFNEGKISKEDMAFASQYSETVYFGKPCGLLDQIGAVYGGLCYVDFKDEDHPYIEPLDYKLPLKLAIVVTPSSHEGLTGEYAKIGSGMKKVAKNGFNKDRLRDVSEEDFAKANGLPILGVNETQKLYAQHFFEENKRVLDARRAILENRADEFVSCVAMSQFSSANYLHNTFLQGRYNGSPQEAMDLLSPYIGEGASRIEGGGFAGSALFVLPPASVDGFMKKAKGIYGENKVFLLDFFEGGAKQI